MVGYIHPPDHLTRSKLFNTDYSEESKDARFGGASYSSVASSTEAVEAEQQHLLHIILCKFFG